MIKSMTGYGSSESATDAYSLKVEIKSLNSKFLDLSIKLPKELSHRELEIKSVVNSKLVRGKVSFSMEVLPNQASEAPIALNKDLFKRYYAEFKELSHEIDGSSEELFKLALHAPEVLMNEEDLLENIDWQDVLKAVNEALEACDNFRMEEGKQLEKSLRDNIKSISEGLEQIKVLDPQRVENIKQRLTQSIEEIKDRVKVDVNRFEQELIYYVEKLDISEEKVRLKSHLDYFLEVLNESDSNGKKLGFVSQEIGREINTIGSKSNDAKMQRIVVGMKDELEQIKEQVLNVM